MKTVLFLFAFVSGMIAQATPVDGILGRWTAQEVMMGRGVQFHLSFDFQENSTSLNVNCVFFDGAQLGAQVSAFATYEGNDIFIQETRETVANDGRHFCRATLQPTRWTAYFDGTGKIVLFVPVPYQTRFTLVHSDI